MLVISRKADQTIQLDQDIVLTVLRVQGSSVRIGIQAPKAVRILRGELIEPADLEPQGSLDMGPIASSG